MTEVTINIAKDFSAHPGGRDPGDGPDNGQRFLEEILIPKMKSADTVNVIIDGVRSFGSSFFEEAFGGISRTGLYTKTEARNKIVIIASTAETRFYKKMIDGFMQ